MAFLEYADINLLSDLHSYGVSIVLKSALL